MNNQTTGFRTDFNDGILYMTITETVSKIKEKRKARAQEWRRLLVHNSPLCHFRPAHDIGTLSLGCLCLWSYELRKVNIKLMFMQLWHSSNSFEILIMFWPFNSQKCMSMFLKILRKCCLTLENTTTWKYCWECCKVALTILTFSFKFQLHFKFINCHLYNISTAGRKN